MTDEIGDPHSLELKTWVNGELRQSSNTKQLSFNCLQLGDVVKIAIDGIGEIENAVIEEPGSTVRF